MPAPLREGIHIIRHIEDDKNHFQINKGYKNASLHEYKLPTSAVAPVEAREIVQKKIQHAMHVLLQRR